MTHRIVFSTPARIALGLAAALCMGAGAGPARADSFTSNVFGDAFGTQRPVFDPKERHEYREQLADTIEKQMQPAAPLLSATTAISMRSIIDRYRQIVAQGGWQEIPKGTYRRGDTSSAVGLVRQRLAIVGDLHETGSNQWDFDEELENAVARYQVRNGLTVTGFVDSRTLTTMNEPARARLHQLEVSADRLNRYSDLTSDDRYIIVNVPAYRLEAMEGQRMAIRSNTVVGKPQRQTPEVDVKVREVNFFPYWRVPDSIARKDLIPKMRSEPDYFAKEHIIAMKTWGADPIPLSTIDWHDPVVYSYKFRQEPGPWNALGLVRLNMPNVHDVYMHDTPLKQLFSHSLRSFSSGCVRVQKIFPVAAWLLGAQDPNAAQTVNEILAAGQQETIKLKTPVPVHFIYVTAWAASDGTAYFRPDIYRKDGSAEVVADYQDPDTPQDNSISP